MPEEQIASAFESQSGGPMLKFLLGSSGGLNNAGPCAFSAYAAASPGFG